MRARARRFALPAILLVAVIAVALFPVSLPAADTIVPRGSNERPAAAIAAGEGVTEQFPAAARSIETVALLLGTYQRVNHGTLHISIARSDNGRWSEIAARDVPKESVQDAAYLRLVFSPPLAVGKGQPARVTLQSEGTAADAVTWLVNPVWRGDGYALMVNDRAMSGNAVLQVSYGDESGPLVGEVGTVWRRATAFLNPGWQALLAMALGGFLVGGVVVLRRSLRAAD